MEIDQNSNKSYIWLKILIIICFIFLFFFYQLSKGKVSIEKLRINYSELARNLNTYYIFGRIWEIKEYLITLIIALIIGLLARRSNMKWEEEYMKKHQDRENKDEKQECLRRQREFEEKFRSVYVPKVENK